MSFGAYVFTYGYLDYPDIQITHRSIRPVARGGLVFGRIVNPISTRGSRLCLQHFQQPSQIFRPSDVPICSLVGTNLNAWNLIFMDWQKGLGWLQAVCTCPQKAIVVLQKFLIRWIPCKKSMQKLSSEPTKSFSRIVATYIPTVSPNLYGRMDGSKF